MKRRHFEIGRILHLKSEIRLCLKSPARATPCARGYAAARAVPLREGDSCLVKPFGVSKRLSPSQRGTAASAGGRSRRTFEAKPLFVLLVFRSRFVGQSRVDEIRRARRPEDLRQDLGAG